MQTYITANGLIMDMAEIRTVNIQMQFLLRFYPHLEPQGQHQPVLSGENGLY